MAAPLTVPGSAQDLEVLARQCNHLLELAESLRDKLRAARDEVARKSVRYHVDHAYGAARCVAELARFALCTSAGCAVDEAAKPAKTLCACGHEQHSAYACAHRDDDGVPCDCSGGLTDEDRAQHEEANGRA